LMTVNLSLPLQFVTGMARLFSRTIHAIPSALLTLIMHPGASRTERTYGRQSKTWPIP